MSRPIVNKSAVNLNYFNFGARHSLKIDCKPKSALANVVAPTRLKHKMPPHNLTKTAEDLLQIALNRVTHNSQLFGDQFPNYSDTTEYHLNKNNN